MDEIVKKHVFNFSKGAGNSGESLQLETDFIANGDPGGFFYNQRIVLHSYCNQASINLFGLALNPAMLRKLADELEHAEKEVKNMLS